MRGVSGEQRRRLLAVAFLGIAHLAGCTQQTEVIPRQELDTAIPPRPTFGVPGLPATSPLVLRSYRSPGIAPVVVSGQASVQLPTPALPYAGATQSGSGYVLNFENVDVRDVLKAVLSDMLHVNYVVDPAIQGSMSLHTGAPLSRDAVLPAFEQALKLSGVALTGGVDGYQVIPIQGAAQRATLQLPGRPFAGAGYRVEVMPLSYVSASEVEKVLEPMTPAGSIVQVDPDRNLLLLAGTAEDLARLESAIAVFDVDWLRSQSFGLFPLHYSEAKAVAADLDSLVGGHGPLSGLVRTVPIDHLNAILVVAPKAAYVQEMRSWINRFDQGHDAAQPRLFVYRVQNGRAADLAAVLTRALGRGSAGAATAAPEPQGSSTTAAPDAGSLLQSQPAPMPAATAPTGSNPLLGGLSGQDSGSGGDAPLGDVRITADENNNALLIVATPDKYALIEAALQQLDAVPLQVLLEASIAEVELTNELKYGLQYYFRTGAFSVLQSGVAPNALAPDTGGLSIAYLRNNSIDAVLDLLSSISKVRVISAPKILVLNNRTASLEVGDQVPIATSTAVGVVTANAPVVNTIQLLDTGIILRVTPRVNSGGLVLLDVSQEVSASVPTTTSNIDSPTIQQRKVSSSVAVQDGQTIALGGLIRDSRTKSRSGIPWLMDVPYIGPLFSIVDNKVDRTELIVLLTPHVIRDQQGLQDATDELRMKLPLLRDLGGVPARKP